jgi:diphosphomevalonate decarboxylase
MSKATCRATSNIAFVKYWGRLDEVLRLPMNGSISMNLDSAYTTTTVAFDVRLNADEVVLQNAELNSKQAERVSHHLDRIRQRAGIDTRARVVSHNNFPMGAGIASSASAFAALTVAGCSAAGLSLDERELTRLARQGSGSACRSVPTGFVEWHYAETDEGSFADSIAPPEHWDLRDLIAITQTHHKKLSSARGNQLVRTSPFNATRVELAHTANTLVRRAILERDWESFSAESEREAIRLHVVSMTSVPPIYYWSPATVQIIQAVVSWREEGLACFFTIDAGANVHVITPATVASEIEGRLCQIDEVIEVIHNRPGHGAQLLETHLF